MNHVLTRTWTWRGPRWWPRASCGRSWAAHRRGATARDPPPGTGGTARKHREVSHDGGKIDGAADLEDRRMTAGWGGRGAYPVGDHSGELLRPECGAASAGRRSERRGWRGGTGGRRRRRRGGWEAGRGRGTAELYRRRGRRRALPSTSAPEAHLHASSLVTDALRAGDGCRPRWRRRRGSWVSGWGEGVGGSGRRLRGEEGERQRRRGIRRVVEQVEVRV